mgnify:CR=1 FL=1
MDNTRSLPVRSATAIIKILPQNDLLPVAAILAAVFLWGGSFAAMRVAVKALNPWTVMWCRMITALALLLPLTGRLPHRNYQTGDWKLLIPMVLTQPCLYFLLESYALRFTTSSQAGIISASIPLIVAVGAWLAFSEALTGKTIAGLFISIGGVIYLTLAKGQTGIADRPLLGNTLELFAMISAAINMLIIKKLTHRYNPWTLTTLQIVAGAVFFIPGGFFLPSIGSKVWTLELLLSLAFLGAFVTLGAFGLYNWGISRIPAYRASTFINLVPVNAVAIGWLLLGERLSPMQCIAAVAIIGGVWLSQRPRAS